ncbi:ubiquinone/menaquinone biosynthesis methyltransferase [Actinorhabdospora filicis]|uniref:Ubiquinone/menaquinone biosynthesis methyltransferase n=1 Tax=Actinorhabdospora filicis TaxID=1785913 RepID=A0A9W6SLF3_9ACTN|nr:methyltransferase domain-containing protein [Actinorhabdospora filicis]GLZ77889.1 ubiquinone/menaquinone biosynthesis methyltransferase [Actinorhabdospora filicis]
MPSGDRVRRLWDRQAGGYDAQMGWTERRLFGDHRDWVSRASGRVLEVAVGTGLNLPGYAPGVRLSGVDLSPGMLARARARARELGIDADLREGDAMALPYGDGEFDTVVCTYGLCGFPGVPGALAEMARVLRPGGTLLLLDHVAATAWWLRALQWTLDRLTVPIAGEHFGRRPREHVEAVGLTVAEEWRSKRGAVEKVRAVKRAGPPSPEAPPV